MKLYCDKCYADPGHLMADNIQTILRYVCKIDMVSQQQAEHNKTVELTLKKMCDENNGDNNDDRVFIKEQTESIKGHIDECSAKLKIEIQKNTQTEHEVSGSDGAKATYASVVGAASKSLIVRPKNKDSTSDATKQMLMAVVDPTVSGVNEIKTLSNGSVRITCKTNEAIELIQQQLEEKEGENYSMIESKREQKSKVKLVGMTRNYSSEELAANIRKQHLSDPNSHMKVIKVYSDKNTRKESYNAIIEFDMKTAEAILDANQISIEWDMCKVYNYVRISRCFKCLGYNHLAKNCKNKIACSKCGGEHKVENCNSNEMSCINCVEYAKKNNENIDTNHHAFAHKCWCTQQMMNKSNKNNNKRD